MLNLLKCVIFIQATVWRGPKVFGEGVSLFCFLLGMREGDKSSFFLCIYTEMAARKKRNGKRKKVATS